MKYLADQAQIDAQIQELVIAYKNGELTLEDEEEIAKKQNGVYLNSKDLFVIDKVDRRRQLVFELYFGRRYPLRQVAETLGIAVSTVRKDVNYLKQELQEVGKASKEEHVAEIVNRNSHRYSLLLQVFKAAKGKPSTQIQAIEAMRREDEFLVDALGIKEMNAEVSSILDTIRATIAQREIVKATWSDNNENKK